jgi:hypothetical protein
VAPGLIPRPLVTAIAATVIAVWAGWQVAAWLVPGLEVPAEIHLAVMAVLGAVFGLQRGGSGDALPAALDKPAAPPPAQEGVPAEPPPRRVPAADLIARLQQERRRER